MSAIITKNQITLVPRVQPRAPSSRSRSSGSSQQRPAIQVYEVRSRIDPIRGWPIRSAISVFRFLIFFLVESFFRPPRGCLPVAERGMSWVLFQGRQENFWQCPSHVRNRKMQGVCWTSCQKISCCSSKSAQNLPRTAIGKYPRGGLHPSTRKKSWNEKQSRSKGQQHKGFIEQSIDGFHTIALGRLQQQWTNQFR